eukprot:2002639-Pleurochrysis_carterae.AAC.1
MRWQTGSATRQDLTIILDLATPPDSPASPPTAPQSVPAPAAPAPMALPSPTEGPPVTENSSMNPSLDIRIDLPGPSQPDEMEPDSS